MKTVTISSFLILFLVSCSKFEDDANKPIIDRRTFGSVVIWNEIGKKEGNADWKIISNGNSLTLFLNDLDSSTKGGAYVYNPKHLGIDIDTTGDIMLKDSMMLFVTVIDGNPDTPAAIHYNMKGDALLVVRDTTVTPYIELKFKKLDEMKNVRH